MVKFERSLIGMIHLPALPGSPRASCGPDEVIESAVRDALMLRDCGFDALLLENMHDRPYLLGGCGPETVAIMAIAARAAREATGLPCGIQILAAANREAIGAAAASGAAFVRVEGFAYAHIADEGIVESDAARLLRYRRAIGATEVLILADIKKKHASHAVTADVSLAETAATAEFMLADGVIVTGSSTGRQPALDEVRAVRASVGIPVVVGSGVTPANVGAFLEHADAVVVGSSIKEGGRWDRPIDPAHARALVEAVRSSG